MHQPVALHARETPEGLGHHPHAEVPGTSRGACVPGMGGALVQHLQLAGGEAILHECADAFNPRGGVQPRATAHVAGPIRRCSQRAWPIASPAVATVSPKTLKRIHVDSLAWKATYRFAAPSSA